MKFLSKNEDSSWKYDMGFGAYMANKGFLCFRVKGARACVCVCLFFVFCIVQSLNLTVSDFNIFG